ncbi:MAG: hypothetical protein ABR911_15010 [Syntrophales bacterium]|jgi:hypothetical protein
MNKTSIILFSALLVALLSGCGSALKEINEKSQSTRSDVFVEIKNDEAIPSGYANVIIKVSIKTPPTGYYLWESNDSFSGKPGFPFVFNVDGQAAVWKIDGQEEIIATYDEKGERIPDGGRGIRYVLNKKIRLATGPHKLFLGVPEDEYAGEFVIFVKDGVSTLEFKPVYRGDHQRTAPSFLNGIQYFELFYDGSPIK